MSAARLSPVDGRQPPDDEANDLFDYCARPSCGTGFLRSPGPGRRQDYCTEACRRAAEKELRDIRRRLAHVEHVLDKLRRQAAAYGRSADDADVLEPPDVLARRAMDALLRAEGALRYAPVADPVTEDLRALAEGVAPLLRTSISQAS